MRPLAYAALAVLLALPLSCRKRQAPETGGVHDTTPAPVVAPEVRDTTPAVREFGFDQRQEFAQSIRQKLTGIDQQIKDLAHQAKSRGGAVSDRALANIRAERKALDRSLKRVDAATAANWEQIKRGVNQSVEKLNDSIEGAQPK
jgi:HPt (histidine-containing phosphotransfer) domain-containing protein